MLKTFVALIGVASIVGTVSVAAQTATTSKPAQPTKHLMVAADAVKWGPGPPALPPGAQAAVLDGDPGKTGLFVIRVKFPDGYQVPPHAHPNDEHLVIVSGTLMAALGDKVDEAAMRAMSAGTYAKMPARTNHYVRAKGETTVQITAMGPFEVKYVNPSDDPRAKTSKE
jgi:quercetin dioxygenase-like cupin family protein